MDKVNILTLTDKIIGHKNQVNCLADLLKKNLDMQNDIFLSKGGFGSNYYANWSHNIELRYNIFSKLPNFILGKSLFSIANKNEIRNISANIVISSGRKTVPIARFIKKQNPTTKLIHILWPEVGISEFDSIILPEHDVLKQQPLENIFSIKGSISNISPVFLKTIDHKIFNEYKKPYIGLIIGGDTKSCKFSLNHASALLDSAKYLAKLTNSSLLITTSRRTKREVLNFIKAEASQDHYFYDYENNGENPYLSILAASDIILVTGDSISMCTDACSSGKKIGIYDKHCHELKKHKLFLQDLYKMNYATCINNRDNLLQLLDNKEVFPIIDNLNIIQQHIKKNILC